MASDDERLTRLRARPLPGWWRDAGLGIFVHWTPASVPAFAPVGTELGELLQRKGRDVLASIPYSEWYENSLRFPGSPAAEHHRATYGDRPYEAFAHDWEEGLEGWEPADWASRFAATGAGYVVFVAKHADGYCLWPSEVTHPHRPDWQCGRDVVGEIAAAARDAGMRFGLYYCGGMDWSFDARPMGSMADTVAGIPRGPYPDYAEAQVRELIERYRPAVLWNDVAWPTEAERLWSLFEDYYRAVPDGVVNDRWLPWSRWLLLAKVPGARRAIDRGFRRRAERHGGPVPPRPPHFDVRTPEYVIPDEMTEPWELVRGMDASFGHNGQSRSEDFIGREDLLALVGQVRDRGGNLLLNVGPRGRDAQIPSEQLARLDWLAEWATEGATEWATERGT